MSKKIEYLWHINNDDMAQFWAIGGVQHYLSAPTTSMPKEFIDSNNNIIAPQPLPYDILGERSIKDAGHTIHQAGYYHSREKKNYNVLMFLLDGKISLKIDNTKKQFTAGNILVIPAGTCCDESVKAGKATVFWLHIKNTIDWDFPTKPQIVTSKNFEKIVSILSMYLEEVYNTKRSVVMLENIADILIELLRRTFGKELKRLTLNELDQYLNKIKKSPAKNWNRIETSKHFGCPPNYFDKICQNRFGMTFSKIVQDIRMKIAMKYLENGEKDYLKIAKKVGYSNVSSLSKAFKSTCGKSLRNFFK